MFSEEAKLVCGLIFGSIVMGILALSFMMSADSGDKDE